MVSLFTGCLYPSEDINDALKDQFSKYGTLLCYSAGSARGAKVAVTATGVPDGEFVITNYNGTGSKESRPRYRHALPDDHSHSIRTWEA